MTAAMMIGALALVHLDYPAGDELLHPSVW